MNASLLTVPLALQEEAESFRNLGRLLLKHHARIRDLEYIQLLKLL